jgi:hypothetical protein
MSWRRGFERVGSGASGALVRTRRQERCKRDGDCRPGLAGFCPFRVPPKKTRSCADQALRREPASVPARYSCGAAPRPGATHERAWVRPAVASPRVRYRDPRRSWPRKRRVADGRARGATMHGAARGRGHGPAGRSYVFKQSRGVGGTRVGKRGTAPPGRSSGPAGQERCERGPRARTSAARAGVGGARSGESGSGARGALVRTGRQERRVRGCNGRVGSAEFGF